MHGKQQKHEKRGEIADPIVGGEWAAVLARSAGNCAATSNQARTNPRGLLTESAHIFH
jgi:hypothetical protein